MKSLCLYTNTFTDVYDIYSLLFMQNVMKVPFKMTGKLPHTLGGGLETWASICIVQIFQRNTPKYGFLRNTSTSILYNYTTCNIYN